MLRTGASRALEQPAQPIEQGQRGRLALRRRRARVAGDERECQSLLPHEDAALSRACRRRAFPSHHPPTAPRRLPLSGSVVYLKGD